LFSLYSLGDIAPLGVVVRLILRDTQRGLFSLYSLGNIVLLSVVVS
jgi:hypothetical protein